MGSLKRPLAFYPLLSVFRLFLRCGWQKDGGRQLSKRADLKDLGCFTFPERMKGGRRETWALDGNNEERLMARTARALVCVFGDVLSGSHLHTVGCNKETRSDYAGSFVRIAAPLMAVHEDERMVYMLMAGY